MDNIEIYLAGYGMFSQPSNHGVSFNEAGITDDRINGDAGLGFKIGLFPTFLNGYLGMELESFGHDNSLTFSVLENGIVKGKGESGLITYASFVNLLLRYPGPYIRPYVGVGGGLSKGFLHDTDVPGRKDKSVEVGSALGYQIFGGLQLLIAKKVFLFGEYKYGSANYHWNKLSLNFRSEYFLFGIGYVF
ncbi:MAG: hypothetical protein KC643_33425 [Nitrospira sp.]|nr:hypothetical protein [Nitrospira sp.]